MELNSVRESFEHVAKKRKLSSSKCHEVVDTISHEIEQAVATIQSDQDSTSLVDCNSVLTQLKSKLKEFGLQKELENVQKELNANISKYLKLLEKVFSPDLSKGYRNVDFDLQTMNEIVTTYLFWGGLFDVGDCLIKESDPKANALRTLFFEMHQMLEAIRAKNIQPALNWVSANQEKLKKIGSDLELKLHQQQYLELLKEGKQSDAFNYSRSKISPLVTSHTEELKKLMVCILWIGKLEKCPYSHMFAPSNWGKLADEVAREFWAIMGQPSRSPLAVTLEVGIQKLPTVLKLIDVATANSLGWQEMKKMPVPLDLNEEFLFHSSFVCPVSREEATPENPPMLLPCGHALCRQSVTRMSKNGSKIFKCTYCPHEATAAQCRQLYF